VADIRLGVDEVSYAGAVQTYSSCSFVIEIEIQIFVLRLNFICFLRNQAPKCEVRHCLDCRPNFALYPQTVCPCHVVGGIP